MLVAVLLVTGPLELVAVPLVSFEESMLSGPILIGDSITAGTLCAALFVAGSVSLVVGTVIGFALLAGRYPPGSLRSGLAVGGAWLVVTLAILASYPVGLGVMFVGWSPYTVLHSDVTRRDLVIDEFSWNERTTATLYERHGLVLERLTELPPGDGTDPARHGRWALHDREGQLVLDYAGASIDVP
jgi:hypothetical protein